MVTKRKRTGAPSAGPAAGVPKALAARPAPQAKAGASGAPKRARAGERQDAASYSRSETADRVRTARRAKDVRRRRWPFVVIGALACVLVVAAGAFSWDRWLRYDDAAELPGEWQVHGTAAIVVIDGEAVNITDDVAYPYAIDAGAKTITYAFGNAQGSGRYRFSLDRSQLVIMDGEGYTWWSTLFDDAAWMAGCALDAVQGRAADEAAGEGKTVLDRVSHDAAATPNGASGGSGA